MRFEKKERKKEDMHISCKIDLKKNEIRLSRINILVK